MDLQLRAINRSRLWARTPNPVQMVAPVCPFRRVLRSPYPRFRQLIRPSAPARHRYRRRQFRVRSAGSAWRHSPRLVTDWPRIVSSIAAESDLAVFCDTSAFDDTTPMELWDALLSEPGRLVLTQRVSGELSQWLKRRQTHPVTVAIRAGDPGIMQRSEPRSAEPGRRVFDYYVTLLGARRQGMEIRRRVFRRDHGRDPTSAEERVLADELQRHLGARGRLLASKPSLNLTDEVLVYLAVEHAISTGRQVQPTISPAIGCAMRTRGWITPFTTHTVGLTRWMRMRCSHGSSS